MDAIVVFQLSLYYSPIPPCIGVFFMLEATVGLFFLLFQSNNENHRGAEERRESQNENPNPCRGHKAGGSTALGIRHSPDEGSARRSCFLQSLPPAFLPTSTIYCS